jgi:hypothetical protein
MGLAKGLLCILFFLQPMLLLPKMMICPIHTITKTIIICNGFINVIIKTSAQNIIEIEPSIALLVL